MSARDSLLDPLMDTNGSKSQKLAKNDIAPMYTINEEPSWLAEASHTERMRLKYEVRPSNATFPPFTHLLRCDNMFSIFLEVELIALHVLTARFVEFGLRRN